MTGLIFSSVTEIQPFVQRYRRGRFESLTEGEWRGDDDVVVCVTGMGKIKSTLCVERMLKEESVDRLLHLGTCTALKDRFDVGQAVAASHVMEGDRVELAAPAYPRMPLAIAFDDLEEAILVTQEHTIRGDEEQSYWQRIADISDMSGYAVAYVAATNGVPCHIVKVISGTMDGDAENFQEDLQTAQERVAATALRAIEQWRGDEAA